MNFETPLVSVIITLYNTEKYIQEALSSILKQDYHFLEIIVVNDGSTDSGPAIVETMMKDDGRIILINQTNAGQCAASNAGFRVSTGEFIKFFDADDILSPTTISTQVKALQKGTERSGSYIDYIRFYDDDLNTVNRYILPDLINYDCLPVEYIKFHGSPQMYNNALWLFHRSIFSHAGLWDERLSVNNDGEFFPRILMYVDRLYYAGGCKLYYRTNMNGGRLSQTVSKKGIESSLMSVDLMAQHVRSIEKSEVLEKIIAQSYSIVLEMAYPSQPVLVREVEGRLKQFDKSYYTISASGALYNVLVKFLGWKFAKRLQQIYYHFKYR